METSYDTPTGVRSALGGPTWEIAHLFPAQGDWSEADFLTLPAPHRFELVDGRLEELPMSSWFHALIAGFVTDCLKAYLAQNDVGRVSPAPIFVKLDNRKIRLPDVTFCFHARMPADRKKAQEGADLTIEVVSGDEDDRRRDLIDKREAYATAGIAEYWIVDPETRTITVLSLKKSEYLEAGKYGDGEQAPSVLLPGFAVDVAKALDAGNK
jgi:Uma2 family endonuclease